MERNGKTVLVGSGEVPEQEGSEPVVVPDLVPDLKEEEKESLRVKPGKEVLIDSIEDFEYDFKSGRKRIDMLASLIPQTSIEICKAENEVMEWLLNGMSKKEIVKRLKEMYPNQKFNSDMIENFLLRNHDFTKQLVSQNKNLAYRHAKINLDYRQKLLTLQTKLEDVLVKAQTDKEYSSFATVANSMLKNIQLIAKLNGDLDREGVNVNVNLGDQVAAAVSSDKSSLRSRILERRIDIDI